MTDFSLTDLTRLHKIAERELKMRERVYPRLVRNGHLSQKDADMEIRGMKEIVALIGEQIEQKPGGQTKMF